VCQAMASCLPRLAQALKSVTAAAAIDVFNLNGAAGGQSVFHVHVHLVPIPQGNTMFHRGPDEVLLRFHPRSASRQELDSWAARLRQALGAHGSEHLAPKEGEG
jgi:histidine triad (HIT) family protein